MVEINEVMQKERREAELALEKAKQLKPETQILVQSLRQLLKDT